MLVLTSIFLIRQRNFDSTTVLRSLAYSIALSVRQAQVYGTSIKDTGAFAGGSAARAYGIYFDSGNTDNYKLFADLNNDGQYTASPDETVKIFKINKGYVITKFCATTGGGSQSCWTPVSSSITSLTVLFRRPSTDACFATSAQSAACQIGASPVYSTGYVQLTGGASDTRSVTVTLTGQISVGAQGS